VTGDTDRTILQLHDTLAMMAGIEQRQAELLKAHTEWLAEHDRSMAEHRKRMEDHERRMGHIDERLAGIGDKLDGMIGFKDDFLRRPPPPR